MKIEIEIPEGRYCTGCMLKVVVVYEGAITFGCEYLNSQCKSEGEYQNRAVKHPNCPSMKVKGEVN